MKKNRTKINALTLALAVALPAVAASFAVALAVGCAEEGESGSAAVDCGGHGTEHDGHCHCDDGYLYDGTTCVTPAEIANICEEEAETDTDAEEEHEHTACLCPEDGGACPCDHGTVTEYDGLDYCVPDLDEEE